MLVNAPASRGADWDAASRRDRSARGRRRVVERVARTPGTSSAQTGAPAARSTAPRRTGGWRRCAARATRVRGVDGLWLTGGTVHPGGGLPLVTLGGRSVARQIGAGVSQRVAPVPRAARRRTGAKRANSSSRVPALRARAAHDRRGARGRAVGVAPCAASSSRHSENVAWRSDGQLADRRPRPAAPGRAEQRARRAGRPRGRSGSARRGRIAARVRIATGAVRPGARRARRVARERVGAAPRAVPAHRREPHGVAPRWRAPSQRAATADAGQEARRARPRRSQTANSAQRRRSAESVIVCAAARCRAGARSAGPGQRRSTGPVQAHARQAVAAVARVADEMEGGDRHGWSTWLAALVGYLLRVDPGRAAGRPPPRRRPAPHRRRQPRRLERAGAAGRAARVAGVRRRRRQGADRRPARRTRSAGCWAGCARRSRAPWSATRSRCPHPRAAARRSCASSAARSRSRPSPRRRLRGALRWPSRVARGVRLGRPRRRLRLPARAAASPTRVGARRRRRACLMTFIGRAVRRCVDAGPRQRRAGRSADRVSRTAASGSASGESQYGDAAPRVGGASAAAISAAQRQQREVEPRRPGRASSRSDGSPSVSQTSATSAACHARRR